MWPSPPGCQPPKGASLSYGDQGGSPDLTEISETYTLKSEPSKGPGGYMVGTMESVPKEGVSCSKT